MGGGMTRAAAALILTVLPHVSLANTTTELKLAGSWIWHPDSRHGAAMPAGQRFFRKQFAVPNDRPVTRATISLTADNDCALWINGKKLGANDDWTQVSSYDITPVISTGHNLIAIEAGNWDTGGPNPAGLIATLRINFTKGAPLILHTDATWKSFPRKSTGWETIGHDDSTWIPAKILGRYGCAPWGPRAGRPGTTTRGPWVSDVVPAEPDTRTLPAEEGRQLLEAEWLFQSEGRPLAERSTAEIGWARAMAGRLAERPDAPDLAAELAELERLKSNPDKLSAEDLYLAVRRVKRRIMFQDPLVDFSSLVFIDAPERYPHESMHRVYPQAQLNCVRLLVLDGLHPAGKVRKLSENLGPG